MIQQEDNTEKIKGIQQDPLFQFAELLIKIDKRERIVVVQEVEDEAGE